MVPCAIFFNLQSRSIMQMQVERTIVNFEQFNPETARNVEKITQDVVWVNSQHPSLISSLKCF